MEQPIAVTVTAAAQEKSQSQSHSEVSELIPQSNNHLIIPFQLFKDQIVDALDDAITWQKRLKVLKLRKIDIVFYGPTSQKESFTEYIEKFGLNKQKEMQKTYLFFLGQVQVVKSSKTPTMKNTLNVPTPLSSQQPIRQTNPISFSSPVANLHEVKVVADSLLDPEEHKTLYPLTVFQKLMNPSLSHRQRTAIMHTDPDFIHTAKLKKYRALYLASSANLLEIIDLVLVAATKEEQEEESKPKAATDQPLFQLMTFPNSTPVPVNPPDEPVGEWSRWKIKDEKQPKVLYIARAKIILDKINLNYKEIEIHSRSTKLSSLVYQVLGCEVLPVDLISLPMNPKVPLETMLQLKPDVKLQLKDVVHSLIKAGKKMVTYSSTQGGPDCSSLLAQNQVYIDDSAKEVFQLGKLLAIANAFKDEDMLNNLNKSLMFVKEDQRYRTVKSISALKLTNLIEIIKAPTPKNKDKIVVSPPDYNMISSTGIIIDYRMMNKNIKEEFDKTTLQLKDHMKEIWAKVMKIPDFEQHLIQIQLQPDSVLKALEDRLENIVKNLEIDINIEEKKRRLALVPQFLAEGKPAKYIEVLQTSREVTLLRGEVAQEVSMLLATMLLDFQDNQVQVALIDLDNLNEVDITNKVSEALQGFDQNKLSVLLFDNYQKIQKNQRINIYRELSLKEHELLRIMIGCTDNYLVYNHEEWFSPESTEVSQSEQYWEVHLTHLSDQKLFAVCDQLFQESVPWLPSYLKTSECLKLYLRRPILLQRLFDQKNFLEEIEEGSAMGILRFLFERWYKGLQSLPIRKVLVQYLKETIAELAMGWLKEKRKHGGVTSPELTELLNYNGALTNGMIRVDDSGYISFLCEQLNSYVGAEYIMKQLGNPKSMFKDIKLVLREPLLRSLLKQYVGFNQLEKDLVKIVENSRYGFYYHETQVSAGIAISLLNICDYNISGIDLSFVHIPHAYLEGVVMEYTNLREANLCDVYAGDIHMYNCNLQGTLHLKRLALKKEVQIKMQCSVQQIYYLKENKFITNIEGLVSKFKLPDTFKQFDFNDPFSAPVEVLRYSPLGLVVGLSNYKQVQVWEVMNGSLVCSFTSGLTRVQCLQVCNNIVLLGRRGFEIELWDIYSAYRLRPIVHKYVITCFTTVTPLEAIVADEEGNVSVWSLPEGLIVDYAEKTSNEEYLHIHAESEYVIAVSSDRHICLWKKRKQHMTFYHKFLIKQEIRGVKLCSALGYYAIFGKHTIRVNNLNTHQRHTYIYDEEMEYNYILFDQYQLRLAVSSNTGITYVDLKYSLVEEQGHEAPVTALAIDESTNRLLSGSYDCSIKVWNLESYELETTLLGHQYEIVEIKVHDKILLSASTDNLLKIWSLSTFEHLKDITCHSDVIKSIYINTKYDIICTGGREKLLRFFTYNNLTLEVELFQTLGIMKEPLDPDQKINPLNQEYHDKPITCIDYYEDLDVYITGSEDCRFIMWDKEQFHSSHKIHAAAILSLKVLGKQLCISTCKANTVKTWNPENGETLAQLKHLQQDYCPIYICHYFQDTKQILTYAHRGDLSVNTLKPQGLFQKKTNFGYHAHNRRMNRVLVSQGRSMVVTGSSDMSIKLLKLDMKDRRMSYIKSLPKKLMVWDETNQLKI